MKYSQLVELYEELNSTTKRLEKIDFLSKFLKTHAKEKEIENLKEVIYLLLGNIYPSYDERKIGISNQLAIKALSKTTGISSEKITKEWKSIGDLGKVAEKITKTKKQNTLHSTTLTINKVIENLRKLPELEGKGTINKKIQLITELLNSASPKEALYLTRTLLADLRIGVQESTIRDAISKAFFEGTKEDNEKIQEAIDKSNDIGLVVEKIREGKKEMEKISLEVGKPIKVMLAQKAPSIEEGFKSVGVPCAVEYKYDGFRFLVHKKGKEVKCFTRNLENVTKQFPEIIEYLEKYVKGSSYILDAEAVGYDKKTKEYKPFQYISQRIRRKHNIEKLQEELPVEINVFDIIYYDGKSLLNEPFKKRSEIVRKIVTPKPYKIITSKQIITSNPKEAEKFYKQALKENQEGIMIKNLDAPYKPGRRVGHMLKLKPEERDLDLVITGAEYGTGKRSGGLSSFILSCKNSNGKSKNESEDEFLEIGKVSTGLKEKSKEEVGGVSFTELTELLKPHIISEKGRVVKIKPKIVISVTYQEIQRSPNYKSGFALRFPRFTALRPERSPNDINTLDNVKENFENQKRNYRYG